MKNASNRSVTAFARRTIGPVLACSLSAAVIAQQPVALPAVVPPVWVAVRPIEPPATPLASETASAAVTKFSFIAYGDTRSGGAPDVPGDGDILQPEHGRVVDRMIAKAGELASTPLPGLVLVTLARSLFWGRGPGHAAAPTPPRPRALPARSPPPRGFPPGRRAAPPRPPSRGPARRRRIVASRSPLRSARCTCRCSTGFT